MEPGRSFRGSAAIFRRWAICSRDRLGRFDLGLPAGRHTGFLQINCLGALGVFLGASGVRAGGISGIPSLLLLQGKAEGQSGRGQPERLEEIAVKLLFVSSVMSLRTRDVLMSASKNHQFLMCLMLETFALVVAIPNPYFGLCA